MVGVLARASKCVYLQGHPGWVYFLRRLGGYTCKGVLGGCICRGVLVGILARAF